MTLTLALAAANVPIGGLRDFDVMNLARRLKYSLDKAGVSWAIGALDYSLNTHKTGRYSPHWAIHLHCFLATDWPNETRRNLIKILPKTDAVPRPTRLQTWDGSTKAVQYAFKTSFARRIGVDDQQRFNTRTGQWRKGCRSTKFQRLQSKEHLELLIHLDHVGWEGRLFLRQAQLRRSTKGPTIALVSRMQASTR